jgi:hypothetical protein
MGTVQFCYFCVAPDLFGASSTTCRVTIADKEVTILGHSQCAACFHNNNFSFSIHLAFGPC